MPICPLTKAKYLTKSSQRITQGVHLADNKVTANHR